MDLNKARIEALESAIKIQSMYLNMPLIVDINAIPKVTDFNLNDWIDATRETGFAVFDSNKGDIKNIDIVDTVLERAEKIFQWLIEEPKRKETIKEPLC